MADSENSMVKDSDSESKKIKPPDIAVNALKARKMDSPWNT